MGLFIVFYLAAVIGYTVNYHIEQKFGSKILNKEHVKYITELSHMILLGVACDLSI